MTEREKREKAIKGLEICSAGEWNSTGGRDHTDCPYYPEGYTGCTCKLLMRDALALLKAQEPRVMEFEEVKKLQKNDVVYLEERANNKGAIPVIVRSRYVWPNSAVRVIDFVDSSGCTITVQEEDFCYRDRCWTSRPTDKQGEAIPWNAQK